MFGTYSAEFLSLSRIPPSLWVVPTETKLQNVSKSALTFSYHQEGSPVGRYRVFQISKESAFLQKTKILHVISGHYWTPILNGNQRRMMSFDAAPQPPRMGRPSKYLHTVK